MFFIKNMKKKILFSLFLALVFSFAFTASAYDFGTVTLKNGSKGQAVMELQRFLNNTLNLGLVVDGRLGPKTILVIKKWQRDHGLFEDGLVGRNTKSKMNSEDGTIVSQPWNPPQQQTPPSTPTCNPSITVLSPNGGQVYQSGQQITVTWSTTCNATLNDQVMIIMKSTQTSFGAEIATVPNTGTATITLPISLGGGQVPVTSGHYYKMRLELGGSAMGHIAPSDESDNLFTITVSTPISTALPQYIGVGFNSWPPVIQTSSTAYSCAVGSTGGDTPTITAQRVIGTRTYCVSKGGDGYAGGYGYTYNYTTANGGGTKTTNFTLLYQSCGVYGGPTDPTVIQCKSNQTTFNNNLDALIDSLM
jgi:peptidoglycan hydrolase-like protein with peptidoglycan-binding domain